VPQQLTALTLPRLAVEVLALPEFADIGEDCSRNYGVVVDGQRVAQ
jgi:hypothetical protein